MQHTHRVLREALSHGIKWGILTRNVADAATPPRPQRAEMVMWDDDTIHRFLDVSEGSRFHGLYHLGILTGLRRSELCGLKWANVDLPRGTLSVVETLQRIPGHGLVAGQPKTGRSRRSVALDPEAVAVFHAVRGRQIEQKLVAGDAWENTGYVFTQDDGTAVDPESTSKDFCAIVRQTGLPHLTLHGLRHLHATLMLSNKESPKVVSERLGHSSIAITMDMYSHVLPGLQEAAALALGQRLARRRRPASK